MTSRKKLPLQSSDTYTQKQISEIYKKTPVPTYLWHHVQDGFVLLDYNEAAFKITKGGIQNYIGKRAQEMYKDSPQVLQEFSTCFKEKTSIKREMKYYFRTTGEYRYLSVTYAFVPRDIVLVYTEDNTYRKKAEEEARRYQTVLENANYAAAILNIEGTFLYVNDYCARIHGYTPDEVIGKNVHLFHNEEQYKLVEELITRADVLTPFIAKEVWHTHKDGTVFPMLMNAVLVRDEENQSIYLAASAIDISELIEARNKQQQFVKKLADVEKQATLGQFTAWLAHEINQPLHIILGKIFLLEKQFSKADAAITGYTLKIKEQIERISRLSRSILDNSKPQIPVLKEIELRKVLHSVIEMLSENIPDIVDMDLRFSQNDIFVLGDVVHLELVFKNILLNAIESLDDSGHILISCNKHDEETIAVQIRDNGKGIPENELGRLFEPFYTTKRKKGGTGIGLPICKYIVEQHGGKIAVESASGRGTIFTIFLPCSGKKA